MFKDTNSIIICTRSIYMEYHLQTCRYIDPYLNKEMLWFLEAVKLDPLLNLRGECLSGPKVFLLPVATTSAPEILEEPEIIEAVAADWTSRGKTIQNVEQVRKAQKKQ